MPTPPPPDPDKQAESLLAGHLALRPEDSAGDFEELCRAHPGQAEALRGLRERLRGAQAALHEALAPSGAASDAPTDEFVRRLRRNTLERMHYEFQGEIARGGMGAILKVWDESLRRHLAMKVILGSGDGRRLGRFLEEAQVTGQLDHPGIVPVHELGLDSEGRVYFTMKLVQGRDLKAIFELVFAGEQGWNETRALGVLLKACEAVAYAHQKGVIHRDLKPANVMVGSFGEVYVMDWGLARDLCRKDTHDMRLALGPGSGPAATGTEREESQPSPIVTLDGDVLGTPAYMAPEQARGEIEHLGPRSDVYSMGAMLYHLLARHAPFVEPGERLGDRAFLSRVLQGPPTPLARLREDLPAELVAICEKAMAREPGQRYPDVLALAEDLRAFLEHRVVSAYETGSVAELRKWIGRNRALSAASAAALLLLVAGLAVSSTLYSKADTNARLAESRREESERHALQAQHEKSNVLKLSAFQVLDDLTRQADELWPATPARLAACRDWMDRAEVLVARLPEFRAALAEIEQRALPEDEAERANERASHPRARELDARSAELHWMKRMLGEEPWPGEAQAELALSKEALPADARGLNSLAWQSLNPARPVYGSEARALLLARRAVGAASTAERGEYRDSLAWALFRLGRFDEALAEEQSALAEVREGARATLEVSASELAKAVADWRAPDGQPLRSRAQDAQQLSRAVAELESEVLERRDWRFAATAPGGEADDRWWHAQMSKLIAALESFRDERTGLVRGISEEHGWGVAKRLEFASGVEERTLSGGTARERWSQAIAAIAASPKYGGLELVPQLGLLPLGPDPQSGLWEFAHVQSGEVAERGADGKLRVGEGTGLVFVLIPGGTSRMGAQSSEPNDPNYDPQALDDESPVHAVTLSPFFLSKYEMTQGQWQRFTGRNPSGYGTARILEGHRIDLTHPVEQVTWVQCTALLSRMGLELPSEAQWEYACRGGTETPWWSGTERESLRGSLNIADQAAARAGGEWPQIKDWPDFDDGWPVHAPVGSMRANPFGLHEIVGNVWEWCRDVYAPYTEGELTDPEGPSQEFTDRVIRGGSFDGDAGAARSARRNLAPDVSEDDSLGLRPARRIAP